jgi:hypothetical protein
MYRTLRPLAAPAHVVLAALLLAAVPPDAWAQTEGHVSVGGSVTFDAPIDDDVGSAVVVGPLVRLNPRKGWGPAGAFNWFRADLADPAGGDAEFARLRIRPLMAGVGYTIGSDTTLVNFSVVAGPSFNSVDFEDEFRDSQPGSIAIDAENSFVVRPGVSITHSVAPRVGITGFAGYMFNRPDITYRDAAGTVFENRWRADTLVLSVGVVYSIF